MSVVEMKMLRWISENIWKDKIQNEGIHLRLAIYAFDYYNDVNMPLPFWSITFSPLTYLKTTLFFLFSVKKNCRFCDGQILMDMDERGALTLLEYLRV